MANRKFGEDKDQENLQRSDLDEIIEVNNKAIELHNEIADQYEEIIGYLDTIKLNQTYILKSIGEIEKDVNDVEKSQTKIIILLGTGIFGAIIQVLFLFLKH